MKATRLVPATLVLVALAAIGGVAELGHTTAPGPGQAAAVIRPVTVTSAARACPPAPGNGSGQVALITAAGQHPAGQGPASAGHQAQAELTALPPAGQAVHLTAPLRVQSPGVLSLLTVPAGTSTGANSSKDNKNKKGVPVALGWSVSATGSMARAMEAELAQSSGLGSVRCAEPSSDTWFLGPGQQNGASQIQLDLMNIDSLAASVDVSVITDAGQAQAGNDTGITVPPHQTVTESLSAMASQSSVVAVEVRTSIGRVAADVSAVSPHGGTISWLPSTAAPSTRLVIPGVPPSGSAAGLVLAVPGPTSAKVNVVAITPQGHYRPFGSQPVELPGQSASYTALTSLGGTAAALEITSNVPVAAGVVVPGSGAGATTAAAAAISEQAVVAGNISGSGMSASVLLSAPDGPARVRLTEIAQASTGQASTGQGSASKGSASKGSAGQGVTSSAVVPVMSGRTLAAPVTAPRGAKHGVAFALVITPLAGSGPVYAARVETQGRSTVVSIMPAASALATISLPPVRGSYDAISP